MSRLRHSLLACALWISLAMSMGRGAVDISEVHVTNVGTNTFTMVWRTSEISTPGIEVYSDSGGANAVTPALGLKYYPIAEGDPVVVNDAGARAGRRALELLAINRQVVSVRVTGLAPGTPYFARPRTFGPGGADNGTSVMPLVPVTTAQFTSMVGDARLVRVRFAGFAAEGMIAVLQGPAGTAPLSAIVGDSTAADSAVFPLANLLNTGNGTNALFAAPQQIAVRVLGVGAPPGGSTHTLDFGTTFNAAKYELIEASLSSPAPFITTHPANRAAQVGTAAAFTVVATGTPAPSYKWQRKPAASATWSDLVAGPNYSDVTTGTLSVSGVTLDMTGDQFRCIAFNGVPPDATSNIATLTVSTTVVAPSITTQPQSPTVVAGVNATFIVAASGTPAPTYQWQRKPVASSTWADLANDATYTGVTTAALTVHSTTVAMAGDQFRSVATNGVSPDATSSIATLTVSAPIAAPSITTQPGAQIVDTGGTANFSVIAAGNPAPVYQWRRNGTPLPGETAATLTLTNVQPAESGNYTVAVSNSAGSVVSTNALLTVNLPASAPGIITQPANQLAGTGQPVTFTVTASGTATLSYQWRKDGTDLGGATSASFMIATVQPADVGAYSVVVTNTAGSATSRDAALSVIPASFAATHAVVGSGYVAGGTLQIANTITYTGTLTALSWRVLLPAGWSYLSGGGAEGNIKPVVGAVDLLEWSWTAMPASPVTFTYIVRVPVGVTGAKSLAGLVTTQPGPIQFMALPDPLIVNPSTSHHGDVDQNFRFSLVELTRVIELYNTRNGTIRTGSYTVPTGATEDGFAPEPARPNSAAVTLTRYHSADPNQDGKLSLTELTRVIELYNTRSGTVRTGQYHVQVGTEDGFAPGP